MPNVNFNISCIHFIVLYSYTEVVAKFSRLELEFSFTYPFST